MTSKDIRETFLTFFEDRGHSYIRSAPIVVKNDPTLMFVNAGMNQFKDIFLGNQEPKAGRVVNTQKCLRVSGKHNDLEEVGKDSYHHTMFEMLGNWSFGDYFKKEAIDYAWELLTEKFRLSEDRLYATIFEGSATDGTDRDEESLELWKRCLPSSRILDGDKSDNFWEMGDTGPCGPCSEIHIDLRDDKEREKVDGRTLVNKDHPLVIELWNLVFIQYNRKEDGELEELPEKHVDTGMGLERLVMAVQSGKSNYDTDLFMPFIQHLEDLTGQEYKQSYEDDAYKDIAMRVVVDHLRAIVFAIADGELPSNTGAGYVIRRILRRAVRYYYSYLGMETPLLTELVEMMDTYFGETFPEVREQKKFIARVIHEEEKNFLDTLADGLKKLDRLDLTKGDELDGETAFELYDTYGFPLDLTELIGAEEGWSIDKKAFAEALKEQKERSRTDALRQIGDWVVVESGMKSEFVGYDRDTVENSKIIKYRRVKSRDGEDYEVVLSTTPFYPEGGGQVGDTGVIYVGKEAIQVLNTRKENTLIIHQVDRLPEDPSASVKAHVNTDRRRLIENNHTATHLLHAALGEILGDHVQQKGSLLNENYLRFDFSHFEAVKEDDLKRIERLVNKKIRENINIEEARNISLEKAKEAGAMMLFGEKYGDEVRMITFDPAYSRELCGGCHVPSTGKIGLFKIKSESSVSAGVRRIEAVTAVAAERYIEDQLAELNTIKKELKSPQHAVNAVKTLLAEQKEIRNRIHQLEHAQVQNKKAALVGSIENSGNFNYLGAIVSVPNSQALKDMAFELLKEREEMVVAIGADFGDKAQLIVAMDKSLPVKLSKSANVVIKDMASKIKGGGGGQEFFASAGGGNPDGLQEAIAVADAYFGIK